VNEFPEAPPESPQSNIAAIAIIGFMAGLLLWLGAACLVLGSGDGDGSGLTPPTISTPPAATAAPTSPPDRTNCDEIRNTEYRSDAERQWFLANCS
jgi:hypothetical protein